MPYIAVGDDRVRVGHGCGHEAVYSHDAWSAIQAKRPENGRCAACRIEAKVDEANAKLDLVLWSLGSKGPTR